RAGPVVVVEPAVLRHAEDPERLHEHGVANFAHLRGGPPLLVPGPLFTAGRCDAHDAAAVAHRLRHEPGGEIRLVVGVRPHPEDRPELVHGGDATRPSARSRGPHTRQVGAATGSSTETLTFTGASLTSRGS